MLLKVRIDEANRSISYQPKTEVDSNTPWRVPTSVLWDSYGPPAETHTKWKPSSVGSPTETLTPSSQNPQPEYCQIC